MQIRSIYFDPSVPRALATMAAKSVWSGAVFGPQAPTRFQTLPCPVPEHPGWIRVRPRMCGICASDLHLVYVDVDPRVHPAALPGFDRLYLGHEVVGEVDAVSGTDNRLAVGDRVLMKSRFLGPTCHSQGLVPVCSHCETGNYALCTRQSAGVGPRGVGGGWSDAYTCHESEVWRVPDDLNGALDDEAATLVEPLACGVRAVLRRPPSPKSKVLVLGCGTIGLGTIQAARAVAPEAEIWVVARYPQQRDLARRYGARLLDGDLFEAAAGVTEASLYRGDFGNRTMLGGFDVVYDCVGNDRTVQQSLRLARAGGAVVVVGVHLHLMKVDLTPVWHQEVDLIGTYAHGSETWNGTTMSTFERTARWLADGRIEATDMVTHHYPLDRWKTAIRTASNKSTGAVKVVFEL